MTCPLCDQPLNDARPWQPDLGGDGGVHLDCLEAASAQDDPEEDDRYR